MAYQSVNPATGEVLQTFEEHTDDQMMKALAAAAAVKDEDEAVELANNSPFGLGGSIYTTDIRHGKRVASRIEAGMVFINYPSLSAPDLPFGGIKRSGYGKELSSLGIEEFINKKLVCVADGTSEASQANSI